MKQSANFFDSKIKIVQIGLADQIFHSSFLLQNFKRPFSQGLDNSECKNAQPCKAEIRWYGDLYDGLIDVRPFVHLWGLACEIQQWHELQKMTVSHDNLSDIKILEMVPEEDWSVKKQKEHIKNIESQTS